MQDKQCFEQVYPLIAYQNNPNNHTPKLLQSNQVYTDSYNQNAKLYLLEFEEENLKNSLFIYNTENDSKEIKILDTPEPLDIGTSKTQLPNGKLFCYGNWHRSGITLIIDENFEIQKLPSGPRCRLPSAIYFKNSVYCFGGIGRKNILLTLSRRFDLDGNRWIQLTPMPNADTNCEGTVFNGNILICGFESKHLLLYSIEIDSFSTIPYQFEGHSQKMLINAESKLYLIGRLSIYESDIESYTDWSEIAKSCIYNNPYRVCYSYNAGTIYIWCHHYDQKRYMKFNLKEKRMTEFR